MEKMPRETKLRMVMVFGILTLGVLASWYLPHPGPVLPPPLYFEEHDDGSVDSFASMIFTLENISGGEINTLDQVPGPSHFLLRMESNSTFEVVNISFIVVFSGNVTLYYDFWMYDGEYLGMPGKKASPTCLRFSDDRTHHVTKTYHYGFVLKEPVQILYIGMYFNNVQIKEFL